MDDLTVARSYPTPLADSPWLQMILMTLATVSPKTESNFEKITENSYDYIIVGSGAAGSVLANRLSDELPCKRVLLLETGPLPPKLLQIPSLVAPMIPTDVNQQFNSTPQKYTGSALVKRQMALSVGKVLGGSTSTNGMLYVRLPQDYDKWARGGAMGWSYDEVLPFFKKLENNKMYKNKKKKDYYGHKGPVIVEPQTYYSNVKKAWTDAVHEIGDRIVDVNNPKGPSGFYDFGTTICGGQRFSAARAYLEPASKLGNLDIVVNATVTKVLIKKLQAIGVLVEYHGKKYKVMAKEEVILSAGALATPKILLLSGIGPYKDLDELKIRRVANLPVGENLQTHTFSGVYFEVDQSILSDNEKYKDNNTLKEYINHHSGFLTTTYNLAYMAFLKHKPRNKRPKYALYLSHGQTEPIEFLAGSLKNKFVDKVFGPYKNRTFIACMPILVHPKSRGTFRLVSSEYHVLPLIDPNFFENDDDVRDLVYAYKKCKELGQTKALRKIGAKPFKTLYPGCEDKDGNDDEYFACVIRSVVCAQHHYAGTCKMGDPKDLTTVVDPELRVKGIGRLRVVDASIMPTITTGNTMIPTYMIGEKASAIIMKDIKC